MEAKKKELLLKILEYTNLQAKALKEEDIDTFQELLNKREAVISEIELLHQGAPSLKEYTGGIIGAEILKVDKENQLEFQKQFQEVKDKLKELRENKKRENFYANPYNQSIEEGIFFDKK